MTRPSITPVDMRGKESRQSAASGRVELLLENGEVEQSWDVGLGNWVLGSSPQCSIFIANDPSIEAYHFELTVGKRFTLMKTEHSIRVADRSVREWLIDRPTMVECGSRKLLIYPVGQTTFDRTSVTVVTHERISDIASKMARPSVNPYSPASHRAPRPGSLSESTNSELREELDELRRALEAMQSRSSSGSDLETWDQKIEQLTSKSISTIEEDLGQRIRQPLREEILEFLRHERPSWETPLQHRIDSLEGHVRQVAEQMDETIRSSRQDLGEIARRVDEIASDLHALRTCLDSFQKEDPTSQPSTPTHSSESRSEYDVRIDNDPQRSKSQNVDYLSGSYGDDSFSRSEIEHEQAQDSEEIIEFQVDDDSISLRLSRMLGEQLEGPSTPGHRANAPDIEPAEPSTSSPEMETPTEIGSESSKSSGRYLGELDHLQESECTDEKSIPAPTEFSSEAIENPAGEFRDIEPNHPHDSSSDEESIEEYMQRLLERVRSSPSTAPSTSEPKESGKNSITASRIGQRNMKASGATSSSALRASSRSTSVSSTPSKPIDEVKSDIQALRELANSNARRAINRSVTRRQGSRGFARFLVAVVALIIGGALFFLEFEDVRIKVGGMAISFIVAVVWGFDTIRELRAIRTQRELAEQSHQLESLTLKKKA